VVSAQTGVCIDIQGAFCQLSNLYLNRTGSLKVGALFCTLSNIYMYWPTVGSGSYAIELSLGSTLNGGTIDGFRGQAPAPSLCHGIKAAGSTVTGMRVRRLNNTRGIESTSSDDVITGNDVSDVGETGVPYLWAHAATAKGNSGYNAAAVETDNSQVTVHAESGEILTEALGTASGSSFAVTLFNNLIDPNSRVMLRIKEGSNEKYPIMLRGSEFTGGMWITGDNVSGETLNGSVRIQFDVTNG
jgi:hypothetical protein